MKKSNIIMSIFAISIGIGMIYFTRQFEFKGLQDIGAGFWPRLVGGTSDSSFKHPFNTNNLGYR